MNWRKTNLKASVKCAQPFVHLPKQTVLCKGQSAKVSSSKRIQVATQNGRAIIEYSNLKEKIATKQIRCLIFQIALP